MKRILGVLLIALFLAVPMGAFAAPFSTATMDIDYSTPIYSEKNWYGDYDVKSNPLGGTTEVFCVEDANAITERTEYDFYDITAENLGDELFGQLAKATWYANWFVNKSDESDDAKVSAQVAIWNAMGMTTGSFGVSADLIDEYEDSNDKDRYISDWAVAISPAGKTIQWGQVGQNYLVQNPVPEPATMLLFGIGLLGLAGASRKKMA